MNSFNTKKDILNYENLFKLYSMSCDPVTKLFGFSEF